MPCKIPEGNRLLKPSEEVIAEIASKTDTVILAFSTGKDAIGAWLAIKPHFRRIVPYYAYGIPGKNSICLEFIERSLRYYEDVFEARIWRLPTPALYRQLSTGIFQSPERASVIEDLGLPVFTHEDLCDDLRTHLKLPAWSYCATGVRALDSMTRMTAMRKNGAITHTRKKFYPIWDWTLNELLDRIKESGIKLPFDYLMFGRSFDGLQWAFIEPIKRHFPDDYEQILQWFPMAEVEMKRKEFYDKNTKAL